MLRQPKKRRRHHVVDVQCRAARALALVQMGELSASRQALEGAELASGSEETLKELRNPPKRPPRARAPLPPQILERDPARPFGLVEHRFAQVLRSSRRGAAAGPLFMMGEQLARAEIPPDIASAIRLGRLTALQGAFGVLSQARCFAGFFFWRRAESVKECTHQKSRKRAAAVTCGSGPRRGHHARKAHSQKNSVTTGAPKVMLHKPSLPRTSTSQPTFSATRPPRWPSTIPALPELCVEPAMRGSSLFQKTTVLRPHLRGQRIWHALLHPPAQGTSSPSAFLRL